MARSDKPKKEKKVVVQRQLTQEELDFERYINPEGSSIQVMPMNNNNGKRQGSKSP